MLEIRLQQEMSGTRDYVEWPAVGETIVVSDEEAQAAIDAGWAELVTELNPNPSP